MHSVAIHYSGTIIMQLNNEKNLLSETKVKKKKKLYYNMAFNFNYF